MVKLLRIFKGAAERSYSNDYHYAHPSLRRGGPLVPGATGAGSLSSPPGSMVGRRRSHRPATPDHVLGPRSNTHKQRRIPPAKIQHAHVALSLHCKMYKIPPRAVTCKPIHKHFEACLFIYNIQCTLKQ